MIPRKGHVFELVEASRRRYLAALAPILVAAVGGLALLAVSLEARAQSSDLAKPTGKIVLTVSGKINRTNGDGVARFDLAMLEALGWSTLRTSTAWTKGQPLFEGATASVLLERVGAYGETALATALNDYQVKIPLSDFHAYSVLLAVKQDGEYLKVRDKGPIWLVYPADEFDQLDSSDYRARWIWQLRRLEIQ